MVEPPAPVWLKTAFAVLVQDGGGGIGARLVRGKGEWGQRGVWAGENMGEGGVFADPWIQLGSSRDAVGH